MHFDQRTQRALRDAGVTTDGMRAIPGTVVETTCEEAAALEVFSPDVDPAHTAAEFPEHAVEYLDCSTHAADLQGYLRFDTRASVADGRALPEGVAELALGPTVHDRVRSAASPDAL